MPEGRHPDKEIQAAIEDAVARGWRVRKAGRSGHAWGRLLCPAATRDGCRISVWSTPRNAGNHARQIRRLVDACNHGREELDA